MRKTITALVSGLSLLVLASPVLAKGDHDHGDHRVESGPLSVQVHPAVVPLGKPVVVEARFRLDESDSSGEKPEDESENVESEKPESTVRPAPGKKDKFESETEDSDDVEDEVECPEDESDDESEDDEPGDESEEEVMDEFRSDCDDEVPEVEVWFGIDFGDGSDAKEMDIEDQRPEKARAFMKHVYEKAGEYDIKVVVETSTGLREEVHVKASVGTGHARVSGGDRNETATQISREAFPDGGAGAVLLARSDGFADALSASSLAVLKDAPVLLTPTSDLPEEVLEEIQRILEEGGQVFILGGEGAVSPTVATTLSGLGYEVERISGNDRVETSLQIARFLRANGADFKKVLLASATKFPDALSAAAVAGRDKTPVLLTYQDDLPDSVAAFLKEVKPTVKVIGGEGVISQKVLGELKSLGLEVKRVHGKDRYASSAAVAEESFPDPDAVVLTTGATYPDALAGGAHAGRLEAPMLLVGNELSPEVKKYLTSHSDTIDVLIVLGGNNAVSDSVIEEAQTVLGL